jgi:hypothetical protein
VARSHAASAGPTRVNCIFEIRIGVIRSPASARVDAGEVQQHQVVPERLVARDPFVVVEEIAAPVEHELPAVHLDGPRMVRGVTVDDVDGAGDQRVRKADVGRRHLVAPVAAPVDRRHHHVAGSLDALDALGDLAGGRV